MGVVKVVRDCLSPNPDDWNGLDEVDIAKTDAC